MTIERITWMCENETWRSLELLKQNIKRETSVEKRICGGGKRNVGK